MGTLPISLPWGESSISAYLFNSTFRSVYKELHADRETGCWQQTAVCSRRGQHTACFVVRGFQRGAPFGTRLCLQSVVCYTCWRGWRRKRGAVLLAPRLLRQENRLNFCEWEWAKNRPVFRERRQVYESPRPSSYAPTCGQSVPKLWPHSRKSSRTAGNRQGWNERGYTRPWPPPAAPLDGWTRRPIPQSACPRSFWFWGIQFFKIE